MPFRSPLGSGLSSGPFQGTEQLEQIQRNVERMRLQRSAFQELLHIRGSFGAGDWLDRQLEQPLYFVFITPEPLTIPFLFLDRI